MADAITWLHLADLHFKADSSSDQDVVFRSLLDDIEALGNKQSLKADFIVISGDVAYAARTAEYQKAAKFLDALLNRTGLSRDRIFLVPGNHDADRSARQELLLEPMLAPTPQRVDSLLASQTDRAVLFAPFQRYRDFVVDYGLNDPFANTLGFFTSDLKISGISVGVVGFNSALIPGSEKDKTRLVLGEAQVNEALNQTRNAKLRIAILHHPLGLQQEPQRAAVEAQLRQYCHFILQGHIQTSGLALIEASDKGAVIFGAGSTYDEGRESPNIYNIVQVDLTKGLGTLWLRRYSARSGGFWGPDTVSFRNTPRGIFEFRLPSSLQLAVGSETGANWPRTPGKPPRVFLSYAREDRSLVQGLYKHLSDVGLQPWMDVFDILPGEIWETNIEKALASSDMFLFCISSHSVGRQGLYERELKKALELWREKNRDLYIIPVRLESCELPPDLLRLQWVDLFEPEGESKLLEGISAWLKKKGLDFEVPQRVEPKLSIPPGLTLEMTLRKQKDTITRVVWSPDGNMLASASLDHSVCVWNIESRQAQTLEHHASGVYSLAWSDDGTLLASGDDKGKIIIWDVQTGKPMVTLSDHQGRVEYLAWAPNRRLLASGSADTTARIWDYDSRSLLGQLKHGAWVNAVAWSPNGTMLATGGEDNTVKIWDVSTLVLRYTLRGHLGWVSCVTWSRDGRLLASSGHDQVIRLWDPVAGEQKRILEGHAARVKSLSFSSDDEFLASKSDDNTIRLWRCDTWETVAALPEETTDDIQPTPSLEFHPQKLTLAEVGEKDSAIRIWDLDPKVLLAIHGQPSPEQINAKVVLLGDRGVGKSGLGIRIAENRFLATESTHGAQFWQIQVAPTKLQELAGISELQAEINLWDLAGQPDYRLVNQLYIDDTNAALLLFDCSDPHDPFRGVQFWAKVLKKRTKPDVFKVLVAARSDVCPITVTHAEINKKLAEYGLDEYVRTCAKTGDGVRALYDRLIRSIPWSSLPRRTTPPLFQITRDFLLECKQAGTALLPMSGIPGQVEFRSGDGNVTLSDIDAVVDLLEKQGLLTRIRPTPSESWVLLRPERLNQYASSIVQAARADPRGLGAVPEHDVVVGNIPLPFERLEPLVERLVLESTVEMFIQHELCFREMGMLVFPSQLNAMPKPTKEQYPRTEVSYRFSGSIEETYASLVVRLGYTARFRREEQWKYASEFSLNGLRLGFVMTQVEEGTGQLDIYFDEGISKLDRVVFIRFVTEHLQVRDPGIEEHIPLYCPSCGREIKDQEAIEDRLKNEHLDIPCQFDGTMVIIPRSIEELYNSDPVYQHKKEELTVTVRENKRQTVEQFRQEQRDYTRTEGPMIHILHLSDIHLPREGDPMQHLSKLDSDLRNELEVSRLEYLVLSGDYTNYASPDEYAVAYDFINGLVSRFGLDAQRVIIVPGNHDVNWSASRLAYPFKYKSDLKDTPHPGQFIPAGDEGVLLRDDAKYPERFAAFSQSFYKRILGEDYPIEYQDQVKAYTYEQDHILLLALNSAWEIDHYKPHWTRSGIHMGALARGLDTVSDAKYRDWLKIAVWHHPVGGAETMKDTSFLQQLAQQGFQVAMHGHIHRADNSYFKYDDHHGLNIIGAGTFGAPPPEQTTSIPLQYNLLVLDPATGHLTVETRKKEDVNGAWQADARWGDKGKHPERSYAIPLNWRGV